MPIMFTSCHINLGRKDLVIYNKHEPRSMYYSCSTLDGAIINGRGNIKTNRHNVTVNKPSIINM